MSKEPDDLANLNIEKVSIAILENYTESLRQVLELFNAKTIKDIKKLARNIEIDQRVFVDLILLARTGNLENFPYLHRIHYYEHQPEHLQLSQKDLSAIGRNRVGPLKGPAKKAANKMFQLFRERKYVVGHIFYTPDLKYWHFFYFDIKDFDERNNHWKFGGKHIHYINDLWPQYTLKNVWHQFCQGSKDFGASVHIKFRDS